MFERGGQRDGGHYSLGGPLLRFLAHVDGLRGEMLEPRQESVWGGFFFLHAELRRKERVKERVKINYETDASGLEKTEESGEWEVKVRRGNQQPAHKSRTLPSVADFINRPVALLHPGAEPARPNERRLQSGPRLSLAGSRGAARSVTKPLPGTGCAVRLGGPVIPLVLVPAGEIPES